MKILVIDDMRSFKQTPPDSEVVYARNSREGLRAVRNDNWDEIYLDHDLGYTESGTDTIRPILLYIEEHSERFSRVLFRVITSNGYAGDVMMRALLVNGLNAIRQNAWGNFHYTF